MKNSLDILPFFILRGVCFTADDQAVVTDFNNHRILVIQSDFNKAQYLGKEVKVISSFSL